jgi:hypothetical protein
VNSKLLLDLGVRYDLVTGFAFDQTGNIIFSELQDAAAAGVFQRSGLPCPCPGFEDFGKSSAEDKNNFAARVGFTYDVDGNRRATSASPRSSQATSSAASSASDSSGFASISSPHLSQVARGGWPSGHPPLFLRSRRSST